AMSWAPFFYPSGEYLIFTTNKHGFGNFELYLVDAAGQREPVRVTCTDGWDGLPVFSPDGKQLSWSSKRSTNKQAQLFIASWNHAAALEALGLSASSARETTHDAAAPVQTTAAISADELRRHVETLASDRMEGRLTGSPGERLAAEYVADRFKQYGLEPAGTDGSCFQDFEFTFGVSLGNGNALTLRDTADGSSKSFKVDEDWRPLAFSGTGEFEPAGVVFAGYGIVAPASGDDEGYDSFVHLDVTDKWVVVFRFLPENITAERRQYLARYSTLRYKAMVLRDKGARGMIVVSGPNAQVKSQLMKLAFDAALGGGSLPAISVSDAVAEQLLGRTGKSLKTLQDELDTGKPAMGFEVRGITLASTIDLKSETRVGRNVLGRLSAGPDHREQPAVLVGAHLDHLGRGETSSSLARDDEQGQIHYGADDNASGVASMLEIAEYLADASRNGHLPLERDIIFAAWSGEELGLLGSNHYCEELDKLTPEEHNIAARIAACVNIDMVGRLRDKLLLSGVNSSSVWPREVERRAVPAGLAVAPVEDAYAPSDSTSFYTNGVPSVSAFTGAHADYHTPRDTADKLDYDGVRKVTHFLALLTRSLGVHDAAPDYIKVERKRPEGARAGMRAYLGTVPDYTGASGSDGVKLTDVTAGAPAAEAGVLAGDVVVELAGTKIENLYDYSYAIGALKIGEEVSIVVMRDGKRVELAVTPASRD
ncbi:MAG: M20/M25/M40 family metallo-hydrolase, partial [Phycisphaerae bacterium]|nr:M20/M25/M40 family metallo-hydrolase [Phycisphaerae bacterium]